MSAEKNCKAIPDPLLETLLILELTFDNIFSTHVLFSWGIVYSSILYIRHSV